MNDRRAALDTDRLPWLSDDRTAARTGGWTGPLAWGVAALLLVGGASYWIGLQSSNEAELAATADPPGAARIVLPRAVEPEAEPGEVRLAELDGSVAAPVPAPEARRTASAAPRRTARPAPSADEPAADEEPDGEAAGSESVPERLAYWPADQSDGATGRVVRVGTFASIRQAKIGWRQIVRHHPGLGTLRATVVSAPSKRNGRTYYRLQFGTTSQAHSEILCQRMRMIAQSCVVVGIKNA